MRKDSATLNQSQTMMFDGWEESTSSAADSPAKTFHRRVKGRDLTATVRRSGSKCCELLTRLDLLGYSLKMYLLSECEELTGCLLVWKNQGTPAGRAWWVLDSLDKDTLEKECGLSVPTPTATCKAGYKFRGCYNEHIRKRKGIRLNHYLWFHGREDLAHSWRYRAKLMGWPEDFRQRLETHCLEWLATAGVIQSR